MLRCQFGAKPLLAFIRKNGNSNTRYDYNFLAQKYTHTVTQSYTHGLNLYQLDSQTGRKQPIPGLYRHKLVFVNHHFR